MKLLTGVVGGQFNPDITQRLDLLALLNGSRKFTLLSGCFYSPMGINEVEWV